jgi:hypothetical protein
LSKNNSLGPGPVQKGDNYNNAKLRQGYIKKNLLKNQWGKKTPIYTIM